MVWEGKDNLLSNLGLMLFSFYSSNYNRLTQRQTPAVGTDCFFVCFSSVAADAQLCYLF